MRDLDPRMSAARSLLEVQPSHAETERALHRFKDLGRRRRRRKIVAGAVGSVLAGALVWIGIGSFEAPVEEPVVAQIEEKVAGDPNRVIYFPDGSHAFLIKPNTQIRMEALAEDLLELTMAAGEVRFEVQPNPRRLFRVRTGDMRIEVLGTSFTVIQDEESTRVLVHSGRVAVYQAKNRHELGSGMAYTFDGERATVEGETLSRAEPAKQRAKKKPAKKKKPSTRWKQLAEKGDFTAAYRALSTTEARSVEDETQELMLAADVARLTGHPREAAAFLTQVVDRHSGDPRALLAAFTLGRIKKNELQDPAGAAEAFRAAYSLAPSGSLAEDALAHEIECWAQAGAREKAKDRAAEYLERYPNGRKQKQVRKLGGL